MKRAIAREASPGPSKSDKDKCNRQDQCYRANLPL
jgi:hypothetical protein